MVQLPAPWADTGPAPCQAGSDDKNTISSFRRWGAQELAQTLPRSKIMRQHARFVALRRKRGLFVALRREVSGYPPGRLTRDSQFVSLAIPGFPDFCFVNIDFVIVKHRKQIIYFFVKFTFFSFFLSGDARRSGTKRGEPKNYIFSAQKCQFLKD